ncbi:MAG: hypothetical protein DRJ68_00260 [Thermoprotei archaeon]|nr:MAG: hypothetical protein DRJ68_00260 [Thermoprotei archaeon]
MINPEAEREVNRLINVLKELGVKFKSLIVFGSAARAEGFKPGVSDVDVLVVVDSITDKLREAERIVGKPLELGFITPWQLQELWSSGDPLVHMLWREGVAVVDDGFFTRLKSKGKPEVTEYTVMKLRFWGLKDLAKAMKPGVDRASGLRSLHHAIRNFARARIAREKGVFAITDLEVEENLNPQVLPRYRDFMSRLKRNMEYYEQLILEALDVAEAVDGKPLPKIHEIMSCCEA